MIKKIKFFYNFLRILFILISSNLIFSIFGIILRKNNKNSKFPLRLKKFLIRSGPGFIKLGQFLATRPDITGQDIAQELSTLQDKVEPITLDQLKKKLQDREFLELLLNEHIEIQDKPVAAGSVAQVYFGIIRNTKTPVAVKILRPKIKDELLRDLSILSFLLKILFKKFKNEKYHKLQDIILVIKNSIYIETNMRLEASSCKRLQNEAKNSNLPILFPDIYWNLSNNEILTMSWIDGFHINNQEELHKNNINLRLASINLANTFFTQYHKYGFFHADIHPGNLIIEYNTHKIYLIDCGIVSFLDNRNKVAISQILYAFINEDYDTVAKIYLEAGYINKDQPLTTFSLACQAICSPIKDLPAKQISISKLLKDLLSIMSEFKMEIQPQLILLQKSMISLEGTLRILSPELNMWELAKSWFKNYQENNKYSHISNFIINSIAKNFKLSNYYLHNLNKIFNIHNINQNIDNNFNKKSDNLDNFIKDNNNIYYNKIDYKIRILFAIISFLFITHILYLLFQ
ncbi:ABC1 kinase family protein [Lyticum sinuosum]|uniref:2-polyprenylphenol 6-hydroxylase n=1 Tax=Lyticum sinuosum TaxID=1332059 RepID=A0AAE5AGT0_9RICK|nr:AarF/UbiB family protein [Lyticum sinuosum]MDZ5761147.1 2-polyprenylphenol 6-hydroxylase [Lyticum sinuosum]